MQAGALGRRGGLGAGDAGDNCPGIAHPVDMSYLYVPVADLSTKFCIL